MLHGGILEYQAIQAFLTSFKYCLDTPSDLVARVRFSVPAPTENKEVQRFTVSLYFMLWRNFSVIDSKKLKQVI